MELLPESPSVLAVLQLSSALVPLRLAEGLCEPLHLGAQLPHILLQVDHLTLPLGLAALQLQPQLMPALLQLLQRGEIHSNVGLKEVYVTKYISRPHSEQ